MTLASIAAIGALTLSACGSTGDEETSSGEQITITYATSAAEDLVSVGEGPVIDAFMAANPDVKVNIEMIPFAEYNSTLTTQFRAGSGPTLGRVNHTDIQTFAAGGFLAGVDDALAENDVDLSVFIEGLVEAGQYQGAQVTMPIGTDTRVLYYNPTLLESVGVTEPPTTWEQLVETVALFSDTDAYGYAFPAESDYSMSYEVVGPYMVGAGGAVLSTDGEAVAATTQGTVDAIELFQAIVNTGAVPPGVDALTGDTITQLFSQGQLAFFVGGPWMRTGVLAGNADAEFGVDYATVALPVQNEGDVSGSTAGGWQIGIFANATDEEKDAAGRLFAFMMEPENLVALNQEEAFPPLNDGLSFEPWASDDFYSAYNDQLAGAALPIVPVSRMAEVSAAFEQTVRPLLSNTSLDVATALQEFDATVNSSILGE